MTKIEQIRSEIRSVDEKLSEIIKIISPDKKSDQASDVATTSIESLRDELGAFSEKISEFTKTIALSVLAMSWILLYGGKDAPSLPESPDRFLLLTASFTAASSLMTAYLQYVFSYASAKIVHDHAEAGQMSLTSYDESSILHQLRKWMFWAKQALVGLSIMVLFSALLIALV